jgi:NADH:ubiquinone oxidoreductase subunit 3 (subunit A)
MKILLSPPITFAISFGIGLLLYLLGRAMAPRTNLTEGKSAPYACGEDVPMPKARVSYRLFFSLAIFFTVMHVAVLVIMTVPADVALLGVLYLAIVTLSVFALVTREGTTDERR